MAGTKEPVKKGQPSIKYRCSSAEGKKKPTIISDHVCKDYVYAGKNNNSKRDEIKVNQILSRDALISAVDQIWDRSDFFSRDLVSSQKEESAVDLDSGTLHADFKAKAPLPATSQPNYKLLKVTEKMNIRNQSNKTYDRPLSRWFMQPYKASLNSSYKENDLGLKINCETEKLYSLIHHPRVPEIEKTETFEDCVIRPDSSKAVCSHASNSITAEEGVEYHTEISSSRITTQEDCRPTDDKNVMLESESKNPQMEVCPSSTNVAAKKNHAYAGALAGVSVSLCLHPLDTVKTITQSCRLENKSLFFVGRSVISERGFSGLYRGIASNIATSAPISALYTFTYESVKGALLPLSPKEHRSLTHCVAGGCSSVATSFVFTPSERIKQQMQVSSHYRNCWSALVGVINKGGLLSLYAGWTAVLCRNIPHSIIKFYVYERLKQTILPPIDPCAQLNTLQTLVCGGLAGSAAAFFTTPFDVVKTRLQTQIPGSKTRYHNVLEALQAIGKEEGVRGLYRGLIPRLVMYMSQGAIFFASYEFYKRILSLEAPEAKDGNSSLGITNRRYL